MDLAEAKKITPDERRTTILDIAYDAFMQDGYSGTSMSRIAAKLGGSKTTLYNYFASKKDLFVAVAERESTRLFDQLFDFDEPVADFRATVVVLARRYLTALMSDHIVAADRLIVAESGRFPEVGQAMQEMGLGPGIARLATYLQRAIDAGDMRPVKARLAAEHFMNLTSGLLYKQRLWNVAGQATAEEIAAEAENIANTFLAAFGNDALAHTARQSTGT
jgi:AcrR family transcriptional regulator